VRKLGAERRRIELFKKILEKVFFKILKELINPDGKVLFCLNY